MSDNRYKEGQKLKSIHFNDGTIYRVGQSAKSITVIMEDGMHSGIPHAMVVLDDGTISKWCLHNIEGAVFEDLESEQ